MGIKLDYQTGNSQAPKFEIVTDSVGLGAKPSGCNSCMWNKVGRGFVPDYVGARAKIAFIFSQPSRGDLLNALPVSGPASRGFFWYELAKPHGLKMTDIIWSYVLRCHGPGDSYPTSNTRLNAETMCRQYDNAQNDGNGRLVSGVNGKGSGIGAWNPNLFICTYGVELLIKSPQLVHLIRVDVAKGLRFAAKGYRPCVLLGDQARDLVAPWLKQGENLGGKRGGSKAWRGHFWEGSLNDKEKWEKE